MLRRGKRRGERSVGSCAFEALEERVLFSSDLRSIDGFGNNLANPDWGQAHTPLLRVTPLGYEDGFDTPRGGDPSTLPSARAISNALIAQTGSIPSARFLSSLVFQWGQFLSHDVAIEDAHDPAEAFNIPVPMGDPHFDPFNTGTQVIPLNRSIHTDAPSADHPRQQINEITSFIDASNVYGSDDVRAMNLRLLAGGRMATSEGNLLPFNTFGEENANALGADPTTLFLAGDVRANENIGLTAMHTLFVREHNRLADRIAAEDFPGADLSDPAIDEAIYQQARKIVSALVQVITYNEFLPAVLGDGALPSYTGYKPGVNPAVSNVFTTGAYRVGHTMIPTLFHRLNNDGTPRPEGPLPLRFSFFNPGVVVASGIDPILKGLASNVQQEIDRFVIDDLRNFLFGPPGSGGFDLASLNIQRGRDHGLPSYNDVRAAFGLSPAVTFADVSTDPGVQVALAAAYSDVNEMDLWAAGLAEDHLPGSSLGETFTAIWLDQFMRLRDGDRHFYLNAGFDAQMLAQIEATRLSDIIARNTEITSIQSMAFYADPHVVITLKDVGKPTAVNLVVDGADLLVMGYDGVAPIRHPLHMIQTMTVHGTPHADRIDASLIPASAGIGIVLRGEAGNDTLIGSPGDDTLLGGPGRNLLDAGDGSDASDYSDSSGRVTARVRGSNRWTKVRRTGDDRGLDRVRGVELFIGSDHNDRFKAMRGAANMTLMGGAGDDKLMGGRGRSLTLDGGAGRDTIVGTHWDDILRGGAGADLLLGRRGADLLRGGDGVDTLRGGRGGDTLTIDGTDRLAGVRPNDIVQIV